jgi:hypothetical protein
MKKLIIASLMALGLLAQPVFAQSAAPNGNFNTQDVAKKMKGLLGDVDISQITASLDLLQKARNSFTPEQAAEIRKQLQAQSTTADEAEKNFNKLLDSIKKTQAFGDPDGDFVKLMNEARAKALKRAEAATARNTKTSLKLAKSFTASAEAFLKIRDRAIKARNDSISALTFIEQNKADYIDAIAAQAFAVMAEIADNAVKKVEEQSRQTVEAAGALRKAMSPDATAN